MSSRNAGNRKKQKKLLYVYRVINFNNVAKEQEITSESFIVMESLPLGRNGHKVHQWRTFDEPSQQNHSENLPSLQDDEVYTELNRADFHFTKAAKKISKELYLLYECINKPKDVNLIANENRSRNFTTGQAMAAKT